MFGGQTEMLNVKGSFLFGDIRKFMDGTSVHYDLCLACGDADHQVEPLELIRRKARRAETGFSLDSFLRGMYDKHARMT